MHDIDFKKTPLSIIDGVEIPSIYGNNIESRNPFTGEILWSSNSPDKSMIEQAISSARKAFCEWAAKSTEDRIKIIENFTKLVLRDKERLTQIVAIEAGKPLWESRIEVNSLITKLEASIEAYSKRCGESSRTVKGLLSRTRFRPHGVVAVLGPYNFPLSMSNGHIMPALIAGNTVVFKPSELTPICGIEIARLWHEAGLPNGVLNCIVGGADIGRNLVESKEIDGIFFVGSHATGMSILKANASSPEKMLALEMGGNSPLVIEDFSSEKMNSVISIIIHSSFISSGQRCSSARRLLINEKCASLINPLIQAIQQLRIGHFGETPEPFYGPMIRPHAVDKVLAQVDALKAGGAKSVIEPVRSGPFATILRPGIIDVSACSSIRDEELFGPILQIETYKNIDDAITMANATKFGLAAGLVTQHRSIFDKFSATIKAGIVNWNQQLTGATTFAPFGGIKQSGNYRPAGYLSADYCSYAVASFEVEADNMVVPDTPGINL